VSGGYDYASQREAAAGPGSDTRQWISNGVVNADQPSAPSVDFTSKEGPLVNVRLHPSDIDVRCRVASFIAGGGQGEWHPFVGGDEVLVALPQGSERGGCIIVGRLNNGVDAAPTNSANIDITKNETTTRVSIPNFAWTISNGWILRSQTTGAQLALDVKGGWMMNSGDLHFMSLNSQGATLSIAKMASYLSIDASTGRIVFSAKAGSKAAMVFDPSSGNIYATTQGGVPVGHIATIEGVCNLIQGFMSAWALTIAAAVPIFGVGAALAATLTPATTPLLMASGVGLGALLPSGPITAAIAAALAIPRDPVGLKQGVGTPGFFV